MTRSSSAAPSGEDSPNLATVLETNKRAAETVQEVAEDLSVIHAVLDSEVPKETLPPMSGRPSSKRTCLKTSSRRPTKS
ncbi:hypothetical protein M0765_013950 [Variovorax sp. S2]|uniref:hypothetical protein n=1 Tax=Variovorax sp. S12S4 TaxID=3029170 RepID=UPI00215C3B6E|nr:hypothetical protein [Variovorax sp. S12S4]MCR8958790.1 hypothetical protein [Variovorax sp. S12S4]